MNEIRKMQQDIINLLENDYRHIPYEFKVFALENLKHSLLTDLNKKE
jgi:hypothetical protein